MAVTKSYKIIKLLNKEPSGVLRLVLLAAAWVGCMFCTGSLALTKSLCTTFKQSSFKESFRRACWVARISWLRLKVINDKYYIFSENLNLADIKIYDSYLTARANSLPVNEYYLYRLMLIGQHIHLLIKRKQNERLPSIEADDEIRKLISKFEQVKNRLVCIDNLPDSFALGSKTKKEVSNFSKEDAVKALRDFSNHLPLKQYPWYVISGTFLGLYRDGGFMSHDYDIDLGINIEQTHFDELIRHISSSDSYVISDIEYQIEVTDEQDGLHISQKPVLIKLVHVTGVNLDLFIHHLDGQCRWHGSKVHRWNNNHFELVQDKLEGIQVLRPADANLYLTENYGDWRTPVKEFHSGINTPNLRIANNFLAHSILVLRMLYHTVDGVSYNRQLLNNLRNANPIKQKI